MPLCRWNSQSTVNIACGSNANLLVKSLLFIKLFTVDILTISYFQVENAQKDCIHFIKHFMWSVLRILLYNLTKNYNNFEFHIASNIAEFLKK